MTVVVDRREQILEQLQDILEGLTITLSNGAIPACNFARNRNQLPDTLVPGILMLDADEINDPRALPVTPGRVPPQMAPQIMAMTPEIYVVLDTRPLNRPNVGQDLNLARLAVLAAVIPNQTLLSIV